MITGLASNNCLYVEVYLGSSSDQSPTLASKLRVH